jgi:hypothetical protein
MTPTPIREDEMCCDHCGKPIDPKPGESYVGSTNGRVWHYGCRPSANPPKPAAMTTREDEMVAYRELCLMLESAKQWCGIFDIGGVLRHGSSDAPFRAAEAITALSSERDLLVEALTDLLDYALVHDSGLSDASPLIVRCRAALTGVTGK